MAGSPEEPGAAEDSQPVPLGYRPPFAESPDDDHPSGQADLHPQRDGHEPWMGIGFVVAVLATGAFWLGGWSRDRFSIEGPPSMHVPAIAINAGLAAAAVVGILILRSGGRARARSFFLGVLISVLTTSLIEGACFAIV